MVYVDDIKCPDKWKVWGYIHRPRQGMPSPIPRMIKHGEWEILHRLLNKQALTMA